MPNVNAVLNEQIRRLARREIRKSTTTIKKATAHYRRDIALLKRQLAALLREIAGLKKLVPNQPQIPPDEVIQKARLRIDGLKTHRAKLGLSAKDYGKLIGVSGLTVYNWEGGKSKPRRSQLPRIIAIRGIGKREAWQRLGMGAQASDTQKAATPKAGARRRGKFSQTGAQMILAALRGGKKLTGGQINELWKKNGRSGRADVLLGRLVKEKQLTRLKLKDQRGSEYRLA
jgi:transcriptional regulator with XRE-family HTH domain